MIVELKAEEWGFRYTVESEILGRLVCEYHPSPSLPQTFRDYFIRNMPDFIKSWQSLSGAQEEEAEAEAAEIVILRYAGAASSAFYEGLGRAIEDALQLQFDVSIAESKILNERQGFRTDKITATFPQFEKDEAVNFVTERMRERIDQRFAWRYIGGTPLRRLADYFLYALDRWKDAKRFYKKNQSEQNWKRWLKDKHPFLPEDLVEWLQFSNKSQIEADDFPGLSSEDRERLEKKLADGYRLTSPRVIALEHAARLCGAKPYEYSISHLDTTARKQGSLWKRPAGS